MQFQSNLKPNFAKSSIQPKKTFKEMQLEQSTVATHDDKKGFLGTVRGFLVSDSDLKKMLAEEKKMTMELRDKLHQSLKAVEEERQNAAKNEKDLRLIIDLLNSQISSVQMHLDQTKAESDKEKKR